MNHHQDLGYAALTTILWNVSSLLLIYTPLKTLRYDIHVFVLCVCLYHSVCFCGMAVSTTHYLATTEWSLAM